MVLVSLHAVDGDASCSNAGRPEPDVVVRATLRSALHGVQSVCDELLGQLALARRASVEAEAKASERIAAIQAEAESTVQRAHLETGVEISELRREIERLRNEMKRHEAVSAEAGAARDLDGPELSDSASGGVVPDLLRQIEALRNALALSRSDFDDVSRRLQEEKQKHTRLMEAVRSLGTKNRAFTSVPAASADLNTEASETARFG